MLAKRIKESSPSLTLVITQKVNQMKKQGIDVVSLTVGELDFDTPEFIIDAATKAMKSGETRYTPVAGIVQLREAICAKLKNDNDLIYTPEQIVVSNGAKHSLHNAIMALINPGDEVIIIKPYWLSYPELVKLAGGIPVYVNSISKIKGVVTKKTKMIIVNSPSNPSGIVYTKAEFVRLAEEIKDTNIWVLSDEIYEKLVYGKAEHFSIASIYPRTVVVNGLSKSHAMTGWRIGYTACCTELAQAMAALQSQTTSNINTPTQFAAVAALTDKRGEEFIKQTRQELGTRLNYVIKRLGAVPNAKFIKPDGAFYVMLDVSRWGTAADFATKLLEQEKVAVIPCESFGAPAYIRISYTTSMSELEKGLNRLERFMK
ncbi:MAG: pyridoxal phosphate-dependent aminotransferase [Firmicutes bacterium]|nr:pyridoxal phosphate-dependent aminotransferase [Bacillota bacterium]